MATKKKVTKEVNAAEAEKKAAKRKARLEAIKNRPEGQRPNGKQIDVIETGNGVVKKLWISPKKQRWTPGSIGNISFGNQRWSSSFYFSNICSW